MFSIAGPDTDGEHNDNLQLKLLSGKLQVIMKGAGEMDRAPIVTSGTARSSSKQVTCPVTWIAGTRGLKSPLTRRTKSNGCSETGLPAGRGSIFPVRRSLPVIRHYKQAHLASLSLWFLILGCEGTPRSSLSWHCSTDLILSEVCRWMTYPFIALVSRVQHPSSHFVPVFGLPFVHRRFTAWSPV